jgi:beta-carotene 15,15'-dioxygenase
MAPASAAAPASLSPQSWLGAAVLGVLLLAALDRWLPHAGLLVLLVLVGTVGTAHGVLDTLLIVRHLQTQRSRWLVATAYMAATLLTAAVLQTAPAVALMVLLGLSLWHFGEHFDHAEPGSSNLALAAQQLFIRLLRGGAPVLIPALLAQAALAPQAQVAAGGDLAATAMLWSVWTRMAYAWAGLFGLWCLQSLLAPQGTVPSRRHVLLEVLTIAALYLLLSPLMAFALYFGAYHATGHIRRVMKTASAAASSHPSSAWQTDWRLWATLGLTALLGAALVAWMLPQVGRFALPDVALRTVILALAAVSVPHVVLIGWWARGLRAAPVR